MSVATLNVKDALSRARAAENEGKWLDALDAYESVLRSPKLMSDERANVLRKIGILHFHRGELELAAELFEASCEAARSAQALTELALGLNCIANVKQSTGRLAEAEAMYRDALRIAEKVGYGRLAVMIDQNLGTIASIRGDTEAALSRYGSALSRYEAAQDQEGAAWVLNNLGMVHTENEAWADAERCFDTALELSQRLTHTEMIGTVQLNRADLYVRRKDPETARACADRAFEIFTRLDSKQGIGEVAKLYGVLYRDAGKLDLAESYLTVVVDVARTSEFMLLEAEAHAEFALLYAAKGRNRDALISLNSSHRLFTSLDAQRKLLDIEKQLDKLEQKYLLVTRMWGESIESKDRYTAGHCSRVADYACRLAAATGFTGRDLTWMRMGGFLHDVGKTAVDSAILNKPGKLNEDEWEVMKSHTLVGDSIVAEMNFPWDIRPIVRNHHERWDGRGYPDGLAGKDIPLTARVLCVADVYDALTTTRSYRPAHSPESALRVMREESGQTLDPELFQAFEAHVWQEIAKNANPS